MKVLSLVLLIILLALQYRLWVGDASLAHLNRLESGIADQSLENARLEEQNRLLAARVHSLKEGTEGLEERARSSLGMIKEGETFFMVVEQESE